jgi:hypothetical protein
MNTIGERSLVKLLLVQAVENHDPSFFAPEVLSEAALAAVAARDDVELLEKRTTYLFLCLPSHIQALAGITRFPEDSLGVIVGIAFVVGAFSNFLGPTSHVHVAYNPLAFLTVWNLCVYCVLAWWRLSHSKWVRLL